MINPNLVYPLFFNQGSSGTFLCYLINLHIGFNTVELYKCYSKFSDESITLEKASAKSAKPVYHVIVDSSSWKWTVTGNRESTDEQTVTVSYNDWKEKAERRLGKDWVYKKLAVKMLPHDGAAPKSIDYIADHLRQMKPILIRLGSNSFYDSWIIKRYDDNNMLNIAHTADTYKEMNRRIDDLENDFNRLGIKYYTVTIENILNLDDNEYNKLIDYLETDTLSNWKDVVVDYKKLIGID